MKNYETQKTYFRNNPKFGRTTALLLNGIEVLSVMGTVGKKVLVRQYEASL